MLVGSRARPVFVFVFFVFSLCVRVGHNSWGEVADFSALGTMDQRAHSLVQCSVCKPPTRLRLHAPASAPEDGAHQLTQSQHRATDCPAPTPRTPDAAMHVTPTCAAAPALDRLFTAASCLESCAAGAGAGTGRWFGWDPPAHAVACVG